MLAKAASASTARVMDVELPPDCRVPPPDGVCPPISFSVFVYQAGSGEANRVEVETGPELIRVADPGATIRPGEGCRRVDRHNARCSVPDPGLSDVFVEAGDGADMVRSGGVVNGGAGNDILVGGPLRDELHGGRGADVVRGNGGADHLYEASPRDPLGSGDLSPFFPSPIDQSEFDPAVVPLAAPGRGRDSYLGGRGRDTISYEARATGVVVNLSSSEAVGGARRENDAVRGVEFALGGAGDDRIVGNRRGNWIGGGAGDDYIAGRAGADSLAGGSGRNVIVAGPGDDRLSRRSAEEAPTRVLCGPGADTVFEILQNDFVDDGCEGLTFPTFGPRLTGRVTSLLPLRGGSPPTVLTATLFCGPSSDCQLGLEVRVEGPGRRGGTAPPQGTVLGSSPYTIPHAETRTVTLGLSPEGLEQLRRHRALRVRVIASGQPSESPTSYLTELRAP